MDYGTWPKNYECLYKEDKAEIVGVRISWPNPWRKIEVRLYRLLKWTEVSWSLTTQFYLAFFHKYHKINSSLENRFKVQKKMQSFRKDFSLIVPPQD